MVGDGVAINKEEEKDTWEDLNKKTNKYFNIYFILLVFKEFFANLHWFTFSP